MVGLVGEIGIDFSFQHYLQHYSGTTLTIQRYNRACRHAFIGKSAVIKCHQLLSKDSSI